MKPTTYPEDMPDRTEQEWRAYDDYYSDQTLAHPYFYHHGAREGHSSIRSYRSTEYHVARRCLT